MAGKAMRALKNRAAERLSDMVREGMLSKDRDGDFIIRDASYSDYSGSVYARANLLSLARDYPTIVTEAGRGFHGDAYGYIPRSVIGDGLFSGFDDIEDRLNMVLDIIAGLRDYPVISDEDVSETEEIIARESWDHYYSGEFREAIESARVKACAACRAWDNDQGPMCPDFHNHDVFDDGRAYGLFREADEWPNYQATEMDWHGDMEVIVSEYLTLERIDAARKARELQDALHSGGFFPASEGV